MRKEQILIDVLQFAIENYYEFIGNADEPSFDTLIKLKQYYEALMEVQELHEQVEK